MILPLYRLVWAILGVFGLFYAAHFLRRIAFRSKAVEELGKYGETAPNEPIVAFDAAQRVTHWFFAVIITTLIFTGFYIYFYPDVAANHSSLALLFVHDYISIALGLVVLAHVCYDALLKKTFNQVTLSYFDFKVLKLRISGFFGRRVESPKSGKYDFFLKGYHWLMTASITVLGITGAYYWDPIKIPLNLPKPFPILFLDLHIISAAIVTGMAAGHVYFALIPENRPILLSMMTGRLDQEFYLKKYDPSLWAPDIIVVKSSTLAKLTNSLPDAVFVRVTGIRDRSALSRGGKTRVRFRVIQKLCGRHTIRRGMGWCSQKHALCSANSCPALENYVPAEVDIQRRRFIKNTLTMVVIISLVGTGLGYLITRKSGINSAGGGKGVSGASSNTVAPAQPIANLKSLPKNSAVNFVDPSGNPDMLIRLANGSLVAYSRICTHAGCLVSYVPQYEIIYCPCHASIFNPLTGDPTQGPAYIPLPKVSVTVNQMDGNIYLG
jgi:Rieske Fe-S protein/cytochrome b subunit of formate dehydrogenase